MGDPSGLAAVAAAREDAPRVWDENRSNVCLDAYSGDGEATEAAFARAAHVVRFETVVNRVTGVTMEPRAAVCEFDTQTQRYTLQAGSGGAVRLKEDLATVLGVDAKSVRVIMRDIGGNFGTKNAADAAYAKATNPKLVEAAKTIAASARLRQGLIGKPFSVDGVTIDGQPFDWSAYAGKVVLVDFWATWCGPCLEELPNIKQNFEQFHAKGFEVVGVNLNTNIAELKQFLLQGLPWATVVSQEALDSKIKENDWSSIPMAQKCGVQAIPFVLLVNAEGKVDSIHVRGPKLRKRLVELLGEPATTEVPPDPTQLRPPGPPAKRTSGKQSRLVPRVLSPLSWLLPTAVLAFEPASPAAYDAAANPYLAKPGQKAAQLAAYIEKMLDRPSAIQQRADFAEAIIDACDRLLKAEPAPTDREQLLAIQTKLAMLHREASDGKPAFEEQLAAFLVELKDVERPEVVPEVKFLRLEQRVVHAGDLPLDQIPPLLKEVQDFASREKLSAKHLRLASALDRRAITERHTALTRLHRAVKVHGLRRDARVDVGRSA